ncbi:FAD-dependent oxidoreductase [Saccharothrix sp. MB29]|nr:FAD-dependent oxidoreductase [Saccharothrix sp. MB29]
MGAALALAALSSTACGDDFDQVKLTVAAGSPVGVYAKLSTALADAWTRDPGIPRPQVAETSGSVDNLQRLRGGQAQVGFSAADAAADAGVRFRYGTEVTRLEFAGDRARAVVTPDERLPCDAVVLAAGPAQTARLLGARARRRPVPTRWSPSAVVVHLSGPRERDVAHHTISFGDAWEGTFDEIVDRGELMSDPSLLLTTPSATDPALAPADRHLHYVLAPCPNLDAGPFDWDRFGNEYADRVVAELVDRKLLADDVTRLSLTTPDDWARSGQAAGTPFSAAHTFAQTGPFRAGNLPSRRGNVVLAGSGTTPGVGIPPVLVSGRLAAERLRA